MTTVKWFYLVALILFVLAALPTGLRVRFEWAAFAVLVATKLL